MRIGRSWPSGHGRRTWVSMGPGGCLLWWMVVAPLLAAWLAVLLAAWLAVQAVRLAVWAGLGAGRLARAAWRLANAARRRRGTGGRRP